MDFSQPADSEPSSPHDRPLDLDLDRDIQICHSSGPGLVWTMAIQLVTHVGNVMCFMADAMQLATLSGAAPLDTKAVDAALSLAQSLTQLALLIFAGSLAAVIGTSHQQPHSQPMRITYLAFVPGWLLLVLSLHKGTLVQRDYVAYLFQLPAAQTSLSQMSEDAYGQITFLEYSLLVFAVWLLIYLVWWIFWSQQQLSTGPER
jgi:hypothetical protein